MTRFGFLRGLSEDCPGGARGHLISEPACPNRREGRILFFRVERKVGSSFYAQCSAIAGRRLDGLKGPRGRTRSGAGLVPGAAAVCPSACGGVAAASTSPK